MTELEFELEFKKRKLQKRKQRRMELLIIGAHLGVVLVLLYWMFGIGMVHGRSMRPALRVFKDRSRKQALRGEADPQRLSRGDHESRNREGHDRGHRPAGWKCLGVCHGKDEQISCGESHDDPAHLCCHGDHGRFF